MFFNVHIYVNAYKPFYSEQPPAGRQQEEHDDALPIPDKDIESNWDEIIDTFDAMELREDLLRGIYAYGFEKPSAIQQRAVKPILMGHDCIAQAQSGTSYLWWYTNWI